MFYLLMFFIFLVVNLVFKKKILNFFKNQVFSKFNFRNELIEKILLFCLSVCLSYFLFSPMFSYCTGNIFLDFCGDNSFFSQFLKSSSRPESQISSPSSSKEALWMTLGLASLITLPTICLFVGYYIGKKSPKGDPSDPSDPSDLFPFTDGYQHFLGLVGKYPFIQNSDSIKVKYLLEQLGHDLKIRYAFCDKLNDRCVKSWHKILESFSKREDFPVLRDTCNQEDLQKIFTLENLKILHMLSLKKQTEADAVLILKEILEDKRLFNSTIKEIYSELKPKLTSDLMKALNLIDHQQEIISFFQTTTRYADLLHDLSDHSEMYTYEKLAEQIILALT